MPDPSDPAAAPREDADEFFVGYLPPPVSLRRFIVLLVTTVMVWAMATGAILVLTMRSPGVAVWESGSEKTWSGVLVDQPYPLLLLDGQEQAPPMLVVSMGKHGARDRLKPYANRRVAIRGYELRREGRRLIELSAERDALTLLTPGPVVVGDERLVPQGPTLTLHGEIVDGKCYLGAMKPGDGNGHRACAILCLRGGLPPMFVSRTEHGDQFYSLLVVDGSTTLSEEVLKLVATEVQIKGRIARMRGLTVLLASAADITPVETGTTVARGER